VEIFPVLRDKSITLPASIAKFFGLNKEIKEYSAKSAVLTGALTFFLPCGFTQAMQLYAVSTGSFWQGMLIMSLFALGTAPGLLGVGGLASIFKGKKARVFFMGAGIAVIALGCFNIANGSRLIGTNSASVVVNQAKGEQVVRMTQDSNGYSPNVLIVKKGVPVKLIVTSVSSYSCASSLVISSYGINVQLHKGENIINFTPKSTGEIPFSCSMGMYTGKFIVTDQTDYVSATAKTVPTNGANGVCGLSGCKLVN